MSCKITFDGQYLHVEQEDGEMVMDMDEVFNDEQFIKYLNQTKDAKVEEYWRLRQQVNDEDDDYYERYQIKGNLQAAVLKAIKLSDKTAGWLSAHLSDLIHDTTQEKIQEFFQDKKFKNKHFYNCLQDYLKEAFLKDMTDEVHHMYLEKVSKRIFI